jgi:undecaprenyl-diphosphatase
MQDFVKKILFWDNQYTEKLRMDQNPKWIWRLATLFAHSGDSWYCLGILFIIWLFNKGEWHRIAASLGSGTFLLAIIVIAIKFTIRRRRPEGEWGEIYRSTDPHSFPSGHATRVFFLASMAWGIAPIWFAIILTIWAPFVAISRVMTGVHYLSDIIAGIIIGWGFGKIALLLLPEIIHIFPFIF